MVNKTHLSYNFDKKFEFNQRVLGEINLCQSEIDIKDYYLDIAFLSNYSLLIQIQVRERRGKTGRKKSEK